MAVEYRENPAGIRAMLASPGMQRAMHTVGEAVKTRAEALTPVQTGLMRRSWAVKVGVRGGRAWVRILNDAKTAEGTRYPWFVEHGTRRMRRQRVLGRAVDQILRT